MKRIVVVLGTLLGMLLATTSPALALQLDGDAPPPPDFALKEDGTLVQGGDIISNCPRAFRELEQYRGVDTDDESVPFELRLQLDQDAATARLCEQNGFSPSGGTGAGSGGSSGVEDGEGTPLGGVTGDGFVRISSDEFLDCASPPATEQYAEACSEAGVTTADDGDAVLLPETGGPALLAPLTALLVASGALVAVVWRRTS